MKKKSELNLEQMAITLFNNILNNKLLIKDISKELSQLYNKGFRKGYNHGLNFGWAEEQEKYYKQHGIPQEYNHE